MNSEILKKYHEQSADLFSPQISRIEDYFVYSEATDSIGTHRIRDPYCWEGCCDKPSDCCWGILIFAAIGGCGSATGCL